MSPRLPGVPPVRAPRPPRPAPRGTAPNATLSLPPTGVSTQRTWWMRSSTETADDRRADRSSRSRRKPRTSPTTSPPTPNSVRCAVRTAPPASARRAWQRTRSGSGPASVSNSQPAGSQTASASAASATSSRAPDTWKHASRSTVWGAFPPAFRPRRKLDLGQRLALSDPKTGHTPEHRPNLAAAASQPLVDRGAFKRRRRRSKAPNLGSRQRSGRTEHPPPRVPHPRPVVRIPAEDLESATSVALPPLQDELHDPNRFRPVGGLARKQHQRFVQPEILDRRRGPGRSVSPPSASQRPRTRRRARPAPPPPQTPGGPRASPAIRQTTPSRTPLRRSPDPAASRAAGGHPPTPGDDDASPSAAPAGTDTSEPIPGDAPHR